MAHGVDGGLVGGDLVAAADPAARGRERRALGDADELEGQVAVRAQSWRERTPLACLARGSRGRRAGDRRRALELPEAYEQERWGIPCSSCPGDEGKLFCIVSADGARPGAGDGEARPGGARGRADDAVVPGRVLHRALGWITGEVVDDESLARDLRLAGGVVLAATLRRACGRRSSRARSGRVKMATVEALDVEAARARFAALEPARVVPGRPRRLAGAARGGRRDRGLPGAAQRQPGRRVRREPRVRRGDGGARRRRPPTSSARRRTRSRSART